MFAIPFVLFFGIVVGYFLSKNITLTYYALGIAVVFILYFIFMSIGKAITTNEVIVR